MTDDAPEVELPANVHEKVVQYGREDESPAETLERLVETFVPHPYEFEKHTTTTRESVDADSRFVLERWPDEDNHTSLYSYRNKSAYLRAHADMLPYVLHGEDAVETDGGSQ